VTLAAAASRAEAVIQCEIPKPIKFSPAHPGSEETITWWSPMVDTNPSPQIVMTRTTLGANNHIIIEIRATLDTASLPGFEEVGPYPYQEHFGPLPAGDYFVTALSSSSSCPFVFANGTVPVSAQPAAAMIAPVVEFYNAALDQYFNTQNAAQIHDLDTGVHPGWARTNQSFLAYLPGQSDSRGLDVQRFYGRPDAGLNSHFLTWVPAEEGALANGPLAADWIVEASDSFEIPVPLTTTGACPVGTAPVYRLWNNRADTGHRYMADRATRQQMVTAGYVAEGFGPDAVFMCAFAP
jgi:hypothetical protein